MAGNRGAYRRTVVITATVAFAILSFFVPEVGILLLYGALFFLLGAHFILDIAREKEKYVLGLQSSVRLMARIIAEAKTLRIGLSEGGVGQKGVITLPLVDPVVLATLTVSIGAIVGVLVRFVSGRLSTVGLLSSLSLFSVTLLLVLITLIGRRARRRRACNFACRWALGFLDAIDESSGRARPTDLIRGSEAIAGQWVRFFIEQEVIEEREEADGGRVYVKTNFGKKLHEILHDPSAVKTIIGRLPGD